MSYIAQQVFTVEDVQRELQRIQDALDEGEFESIRFHNEQTAPEKPQEERLYKADGVNWDPGDGEGLYIYKDGAYYKLVEFSIPSDLTQINGNLLVTDDTFLGGTTTPTATLHLAAGSTAAGSAPLKFTSGPLLTTPEPGVMEYNNSHFYLTTEQATRTAIVSATDVVTSTTTVTNTVTETTIFTKTFPADALHEDMLIDLALTGGVTNASASDDFTFNFKVGGSTVYTLSRVGGNVTDAGWEILFRFSIRTTGASGTFVDYARYSESGIPPVSSSLASTHSVDTTGTVVLEVTITWANAKAGNVFTASQGFIQYNH